MKKILVALLILVIVFAVGCGDKKTPVADDTETGAQNVTNTPTDDTDPASPEDTSVPGDTDVADESAADTEKVDASTDASGFTVTDESGTLVIYPEFPEQVRRIYDYNVSVTMGKNTKTIPVYNHTVESNVSRRPGMDMYRRFSLFAFDGGSVRVDVKVNTDFKKYTVFPSAKNFKHEFKDGVISVYLDKPDYFGIQLDDDQNTILSVFADAPETNVPKKGDANVVYIEGWYEPESGTIIYDKPNTVVYLAPGAVFNARIRFTGEGCKFIGRGLVVDPFENIYEYDIQNGGTESHGFNLVTFSCNKFVCDGIVLTDARCFNIVTKGDDGIIRNTKCLSSMMTTDGITAQGNNTLAEHNWIYCGDNGIVPSNLTNSTFRDIAIGTTCAAMFPQLTCENVLFEDINVFRADDGIISNRYNGSGKAAERTHRVQTVTFRRLAAVELPEKTGVVFFQSGNMGELQKTFTFEQITVPSVTSSVWYRNDTSILHSENYKLNFVDYYEAGKLAKSDSDISVKNDGGINTIEHTFKTTSFKPVVRNEKDADYTAENKTYIGMRQIFLSTPAKVEGKKIMLPTSEICKLLRGKAPSNDAYIEGNALVKAGLAESVSEKHGTIYIVPKYSGENMILPDEGEISYFAENTCYDLDLTTTKDKDGYIYNILNIDTATAGISRRVTDEFQMYGEGKYRITFKARSDTKDATLAFRLQYSSYETLKTFVAQNEWKEFTFEFDITSEYLDATKDVIVINSPAGVYKNFFIRDFTMTKIK